MPPNAAARVRRECVARDEEISPQRLADIVRSVEPGLSRLQQLAVLDEVLIDQELLGPLAQLIPIPHLTDIVVNAHDDVWIDAGQGMRKVPVGWVSENELREFASRLAHQVNRRLDDSNPWVDGQLPNGFRMNAVIPPLSVRGTCISLRQPANRGLTVADLVRCNSLCQAGATLLRQVVDHRLTFVVCGGTGAGKTTILNAMLNHISPTERIVVVEDSTELRLSHPHVVSLQARLANTEGVGEVTLRAMLRQALRMRPDRLVVGEVRGIEVLDLLLAVNTGHRGSGVTIHANSSSTLPLRFEALGLLANMSPESVRAQCASGFDVIVEAVRDHDGARRLGNLAILSPRGGELHVQEVMNLHTGTYSDVGMAMFLELIGSH